MSYPYSLAHSDCIKNDFRFHELIFQKLTFPDDRIYEFHSLNWLEFKLPIKPAILKPKRYHIGQILLHAIKNYISSNLITL